MKSSCLKTVTEPNKQTSGFTIIEVVLVLAIAGLIFLTVFLAVPNMQKSQRDNRRKQELAQVLSALQSYKADNGKYPGIGGSTGGLVSTTNAPDVYNFFVGYVDWWNQQGDNGYRVSYAWLQLNNRTNLNSVYGYGGFIGYSINTRCPTGSESYDTGYYETGSVMVWITLESSGGTPYCLNAK